MVNDSSYPLTLLKSNSAEFWNIFGPRIFEEEIMTL